MTASKIFLYFCLLFIGGIFLSSFLEISHLLLLGFLILGTLLISVFWPFGELRASVRRKQLAVIGFCFLFLVVGIWRHQQAELRITNNELRKYNDLEQNITLIGQVTKEPDIRENNIKLTIQVESINWNEKCSRSIKGKVLATTWRYPEYQYGDKLKITGKLETPQNFADFNYQDYLAKEGIYSIIFSPRIELLKRGNYQGLISIVYSKNLLFKNRLRENVYQNLSPPQSSILGAIILGDKRKISEEWKGKLNIAGVRHITCVSGMHIIILAGILMWLGMALGLYRGQAFYFAIILLLLFIIMVGAPPSAIRAGIMGGLLLFAQKIGRLRLSGRAITFAAAAMLIQNPLLLKSDVGFQLSFLAALGIIYLMPSFQDWFKKIPNNQIFPLRNLLSMTLAAQVFTLPILIYNFGYFSQIAPMTNILIVPLLPYIMVLGFIFSLAGVIWSPLGWIFSWPAWFLLTYLIKIVDWFSRISWASLTLEISWIWLIISYIILGLATWRLNSKEKLKFLNY